MNSVCYVESMARLNMLHTLQDTKDRLETELAVGQSELVVIRYPSPGKATIEPGKRGEWSGEATFGGRVMSTHALDSSN